MKRHFDETRNGPRKAIAEHKSTNGTGSVPPGGPWDANGHEPLPRSTRKLNALLQTASESGDLGRVIEVLETKKHLEVDDALCAAAVAGQTVIVEYLYHNANVMKGNLNSVLSKSYHHWEMAKLLQSLGANDPDLFLNAICHNGDVSSLQAVLNRGCTVSLETLDVACRAGQVEIVKVLVNHFNASRLQALLPKLYTYKHPNCLSPILNKLDDATRTSALYDVFENGDSVTVTGLALEYPDMARKFSVRVLAMSCGEGSLQVVQQIVNDCDDLDLWYGFGAACEHGHLDIVQFFSSTKGLRGTCDAYRGLKLVCDKLSRGVSKESRHRRRTTVNKELAKQMGIPDDAIATVFAERPSTRFDGNGHLTPDPAIRHFTKESSTSVYGTQAIVHEGSVLVGMTSRGIPITYSSHIPDHVRIVDSSQGHTPSSIATPVTRQDIDKENERQNGFLNNLLFSRPVTRTDIDKENERQNEFINNLLFSRPVTYVDMDTVDMKMLIDNNLVDVVSPNAIVVANDECEDGQVLEMGTQHKPVGNKTPDEVEYMDNDAAIAAALDDDRYADKMEFSDRVTHHKHSPPKTRSIWTPQHEVGGAKTFNPIRRIDISIHEPDNDCWCPTCIPHYAKQIEVVRFLAPQIDRNNPLVNKIPGKDRIFHVDLTLFLEQQNLLVDTLEHDVEKHSRDIVYLIQSGVHYERFRPETQVYAKHIQESMWLPFMDGLLISDLARLVCNYG